MQARHLKSLQGLAATTSGPTRNETHPFHHPGFSFACTSHRAELARLVHRASVELIERPCCPDCASSPATVRLTGSAASKPPEIVDSELASATTPPGTGTTATFSSSAPGYDEPFDGLTDKQRQTVLLRYLGERTIPRSHSTSASASAPPGPASATASSHSATHTPTP